MLEKWYEMLNWLLVLDQEKLALSHMVLRALIVYILGVILIRLDKRFIGERTAFNTILRFLIGSALAKWYYRQLFLFSYGRLSTIPCILKSFYCVVQLL